MTTKEAKDFFGGTKALADKLGMWPQAVYQWGKYPPRLRQYEIQKASDGKLKVEDD